MHNQYCKSIIASVTGITVICLYHSTAPHLQLRTYSIGGHPSIVSLGRRRVGRRRGGVPRARGRRVGRRRRAGGRMPGRYNIY